MAKPVVDGIERDLEDRAEVVRLSVMSRVGGMVAQRYGIRGIPTLLLFDGKGNLVSRGLGVPNRKSVVSQVEQLLP